MIRITHVVSPHHFYFKWSHDLKEFDEDLQAFEVKLLDYVQQVKRDGLLKKIVVGQQVGLFFADLHKWIRGAVKSIDTDDRVYLWCIDYGFPLVARQSDVVPLKKSMNGFQATKQAVHRGGISNCVPTGKEFIMHKLDFEDVTKMMWSPEAIQTFDTILVHAVDIQLKDIQTMTFGKKEHHFGRLMVTSPTGVEMNILKCLLDMNVAKIVVQEEFHAFISAPDRPTPVNWKNAIGVPMTSAVRSSAVIFPKELECADDAYMNAEETLTEMADLTITASDEDNAFFDSSMSVLNLSIKDGTDNIVSEADASSRISSETVVVQRSSNGSSQTKSNSFGSRETLASPSKPSNGASQAASSPNESQGQSGYVTQLDATKKCTQMPKNKQYGRGRTQCYDQTNDRSYGMNQNLKRNQRSDTNTCVNVGNRDDANDVNGGATVDRNPFRKSPKINLN